MTYSTGNDERDKLLVRAIKECKALGDLLDLPSVAALLPGDFNTDSDELAGMVEALFGAPDEPPVRRAADTPQVPRELAAHLENVRKDPMAEIVAAAQPKPIPVRKATVEPTPPAEPPSVNEMEARRAAESANARLVAAREAMQLETYNLRPLREAVASAVTQWQISSGRSKRNPPKSDKLGKFGILFSHQQKNRRSKMVALRRVRLDFRVPRTLTAWRTIAAAAALTTSLADA